MRTSSGNLFVGVICLLTLSVTSLPADQLMMQNGDRYVGTILSVSADSVVLQSEVLGKVTLPKSKVSSLSFGNTVAASAAPAAPATVVSAPSPSSPSTNADLAAAFRSLGANTNFVRQVSQQLLAGSPEANAKYDEMVDGLMSGKLNLTDLRNQARTSINQINQLKKELGPDADDALDGYLSILENFVSEAGTEEAPVKPAGNPATTNMSSVYRTVARPVVRPGVSAKAPSASDTQNP